MPTRDEKNEFSILIMTRAADLRTDHMDALITYCEEIGLEMEVAATLVNDILKAKIHDEAVELNYIEKSGKLPL